MPTHRVWPGDRRATVANPTTVARTLSGRPLAGRGRPAPPGPDHPARRRRAQIIPPATSPEPKTTALTPTSAQAFANGLDRLAGRASPAAGFGAGPRSPGRPVADRTVPAPRFARTGPPE